MEDQKLWIRWRRIRDTQHRLHQQTNPHRCVILVEVLNLFTKHFNKVILALASSFQLKLQPNWGGFRNGYTLLGSSIAKLHFENQPIMHTTRKH
jgi:hypothetical protein